MEGRGGVAACALVLFLAGVGMTIGGFLEQVEPLYITGIVLIAVSLFACACTAVCG